MNNDESKKLTRSLARMSRFKPNGIFSSPRIQKTKHATKRQKGKHARFAFCLFANGGDLSTTATRKYHQQKEKAKQEETSVVTRS